MIRLLIADDHCAARDRLRQLFGPAGDVVVSAKARDGEQALLAGCRGAIDLTLINLNMPGPIGVELIERIRALDSRLPNPVLSFHNEPQIVQRVLGALRYTWSRAATSSTSSRQYVALRPGAQPCRLQNRHRRHRWSRRTMMIRVLVADDHALVRQGLLQLLSSMAEFRLVGEARNAWEVIECVRHGGIDLLLLDLSMPGPSGVELIRRLRGDAPQMPVLVVSMHAEVQLASRAIKAGASGYVTKDSEPELLLEAIRQVARGSNFIDPVLATRLVFDTGQSSNETPHASLSNREYQVFLALVAGRSLIDIADALKLSPKTVSTHKFRLMQKLGVDSVSELVRYAIRHGLVE